MSSFDIVRMRKQGEEAREKVLQMISSPAVAQDAPVSRFDSIRNRSISATDSAVYNLPSLSNSFTDSTLSKATNGDKAAQAEYEAATGMKFNPKVTTEPIVMRRNTMPVSEPTMPLQTPNITRLFAATGDKEALASFKEQTGFDFGKMADGRSQYEQEQENINKSDMPGVVKGIASAGNFITRGNPLGKFLSQATSVPGVSMGTNDSTGNKVADAVGGFLGRNVSPFLVPTGAPVGSGPMAAPYEAAGKLLNTGLGQKATNALGNQLSKVPLISKGAGQNLAKVGLTEGMAGTIQNPMQELVNDSGRTGKELALDAAIGGVAGFGLGMAGEGVGMGISKLLGRGKTSNVENFIPETSPITRETNNSVNPLDQLANQNLGAVENIRPKTIQEEISPIQDSPMRKQTQPEVESPTMFDPMDPNFFGEDGIPEFLKRKRNIQPEPDNTFKLNKFEAEALREASEKSAKLNKPDNLIDDIDDSFADDIELPELDEVSPKIRERVNTFADQMIENAKLEIAKSRNRLSSNPVDVYAQYAKIGAGYMLKGSVKLADFTEQMVKTFGEEIRPSIKKIFTQSKEEYKNIKREIEHEELGLNGLEAQKYKDLSNINLNSADVYRNFKKVFGKDYDAVKKGVLDPFDTSKGAYADEQKNLTDKLYEEIVQGLGIKKGSKDSELIQRYGEGQIDIARLKDSTNNWENVLRADKWFRNEYDQLIDRVNESIASIYPTRPEKLVPKREDYYRHFQEMTAWSGLKNIFDSTSARISPALSGISPFVKPKTKWASFKQARGLGEYKNDAVGGFLDYIPAASYAIHIDPHISTFRNLAKRLAEDTDKTANINGFIAYLNKYANDLAGKTAPIDLWIEEIGNRKGVQLISQLNNRVKSNTILGNAGSVIAQSANIPIGIAYGGQDAVTGLARTVSSVFQANEAMAKSNFIKERLLDKSFRRFDQKWWEQPKRFAQSALEIGDIVGTSFIWNTAYEKGVRKAVSNPIKFADDETRRLVAGRGIGEQPLYFKSKTLNIFAPFQLEVNNLWRVMKDFVDEKQFGALATLFVGNFVFNKIAESIRGNGVTFDPIDAIYEAVMEEDVSILQRGGRVVGEMLSNMPLGQNLAGMYPEYGTNLSGVQLPTREQLFGDKDPTRFGEGLLLTKGIQDPIFKLLTPWGGGQLKKTIQGADALARGGSYTKDFIKTGLKIEEPKLKFPVKPSLENIVKGSLFGPYAFKEGKEYSNLDRRPLSEKQTKGFERSNDPDTFYDNLMKKRSVEKEKRKVQEARKKQIQESKNK